MSMIDKDLIINMYSADGTISHNNASEHDALWDSIYDAIPNYLFHPNSTIIPVVAIRELDSPRTPYFWHPIHNIFAGQNYNMVDIRIWSKLDTHNKHLVRGVATLSIDCETMVGYHIWFKHCTVNKADDIMYDMIYRISKVLSAQHACQISVYEKRTHIKPSHKIHHIRNFLKMIIKRRNNT